MAKIPTPRSFNQIVGDQIDSFLSHTGLSSIRPGSPFLSFIMASAQSDLRNSQDNFNFLNSNSLDSATGSGLDKKGGDEEVVRLSEGSSSGSVTITDSRFSKVSSKISQNHPAPIVGSQYIYISDSYLFTSTGSLYIGRGTINYEGPLAYTSIDVNGRVTLSNRTLKYHNLNETVILAQGGDRTIYSGLTVQTPQGNTQDAVKFPVTFTSIIPDGEISLSGIQVTCGSKGVIGNVSGGAISGFASLPFPGATVTNPMPFTNGVSTETDSTYRERIKSVRKSRSKSTEFAIQTSAVGLISPNENKRITSSSVVSRQGYPTTLYIDDGTGYEESSSGVAIESLVDLATGGEEYTQLSERPVTKAFVTSSATSPFILTDGSVLSVKIGGIPYEHTFGSDLFRDIGNATAHEIVASINGSSSLGFIARTSGVGTKVILSAKSETNESIQVLSGGSNDSLLFPTTNMDTISLYKSDRLLSKDGFIAVVESNPFAFWDSMSSGVTLIIDVDGTGSKTYTFLDEDFVNAETGYFSVGKNSISAWVSVLNSKIPGVTAMESGGKIVLSSNIGPSSRGKISILSSGLVLANMFDAVDSYGKPNDYTLNRNTGQIRLNTPLLAGESLSCGSTNTRSFIEFHTQSISTLATDGLMYFAVDGSAKIIKTGVNALTSFTIVSRSTSWGQIIHFDVGAALFTNLKLGDWVLIWDPSIPACARGTYQISSIDPSFTWFNIEILSGFYGQTTTTLSEGGMVFVRSESAIQKIVIPAGINNTALSFSRTINASLNGATANVHRTKYLRISTNTFGTNGGIALVAVNNVLANLRFIAKDSVDNINGQPAFIESSASGSNPYLFEIYAMTDQSDRNSPIVKIGNSYYAPRTQDEFVVSSPYMSSGSTWNDRTRGCPNSYFRSYLESSVGHDIVLRESVSKEFLNTDPAYFVPPYSFTPEDSLTVVVDQDISSKRFIVPLSRPLNTVGNYGSTCTFSDALNGTSSLAASFGLDFNFNDYALFMSARALSGTLSDDTQILWRYQRPGPDGNDARIRYVYPSVINSPISVDQIYSSSQNKFTDINVTLPSSVAKTVSGLNANTQIGRWRNQPPEADGVHTEAYILGYPISLATRRIQLDYNRTVSVRFTTGSVVTGTVSGATATVLADSQVPGLTGPSKLTLTILAPVFQFASGEALTCSDGGTGNALSSQYGMVHLVATLPLILNANGPGSNVQLTGHGIEPGSSIYLQSNSPHFPSSHITLATDSEYVGYPDTVNIGYADLETWVGSVSDIGTVSYNNSAITFTAATPAPIVVGDLIRFSRSRYWAGDGINCTLMISQIGDQYVVVKHNTTADGSSALSPYWRPIGSAQNVLFMSLDQELNTATNICTTISSLVSEPNSTCPVTATLLGTGLGCVGKSHFDTNLVNDSYSLFSDGINFVKTTINPANPTLDYQFNLKNAVNSDLVSGCDWASEAVWIVPITAPSLVEWMNSFAVTGLSSVSSIALSSQGRHVQFSSLEPGKAKSIQFQGGTANTATATVIGSATTYTYPKVSVSKSDSIGFLSDSWVCVQNTNQTKKTPFNDDTVIVSVTPAGVFSVDSQSPTKCQYLHLNPVDKIWKIEKQGNLVCYSIRTNAPNISDVKIGDFLVVSKAGPIPGNVDISDPNTGVFRIQNKSNTSFYGIVSIWVENANAINEEVWCNVSALGSESIMPGDTVKINTSMFGSKTVGSWEVLSATAYTFSVDVSKKITDTYSGSISLGNAGSFIQVFDRFPLKIIKQLKSICVNSVNSNHVDFKFTDNAIVSEISETYGSVISQLDKLNFSTNLVSGSDGFSYSTGLIGEANRVLYGVPSNPTIYPGVVAAGSSVNISGSIIKRITCSFALRVRSGVSKTDITNRVKSAVASAVNKTDIGKPVAISVLVSAVSKVTGVVAVTVTDPIYGSGNDLIPVQPYEKPMVLDLEQDISVSFVGV